MLIFKNNIYDRQEIGLSHHSSTADDEYDAIFDPLHFISMALDEEDAVLDFLERQPIEYWPEDSKNFYPNAWKVGSRSIFRNLLGILQDGLNERTTWYKMNTYHFCFLYDILIRYSFNYNHDNTKERLNALPEIKGKPLQIEMFLKDYFYNTIFLMKEEKYNSLTRAEKLELGNDCPCQFAVINALSPTKKEMELQASQDYPYSIYV